MSDEISLMKKKLVTGLISVVVKKTGPRHQLDPLFYAEIASVPIVFEDMLDLVVDRVALDFKKPDGEDWESFFVRNGYKIGVCSESDILFFNQLQNFPPENIAGSRFDFFTKVNNFLEKHEKMYARSIILTEKFSFETTSLSTGLTEFSYPSLDFNRDGTFRLAAIVCVNDYVNNIFYQEFSSDPSLTKITQSLSVKNYDGSKIDESTHLLIRFVLANNHISKKINEVKLVHSMDSPHSETTCDLSISE